MAVYVDQAKHPFGRMVMCHLWADSIEELYAMADKIGVARKWLQRPPETGLPGMNASWVHFDIAKSKRALAVKFGAIETDKYGPSEHVARLEGNQRKLDWIAELRAREGKGQAKLALERDDEG